MTLIKYERKYMNFTLTRNFKVLSHWDRDEIMPRYYVLISWIFQYFYTMCCFLRTTWYQIIQNFNSRLCLVLEISNFEFDAYYGFRAGAGVRKLFVSGVFAAGPAVRRSDVDSSRTLLTYGRCPCYGAPYHIGPVPKPWWRHKMETFSALLAICAGNSPVTGEFPAQRPVTRSFDVFFDLCPNKRLSKQSWGWWFETPSGSLWLHSNAFVKGGYLKDS